MTLSSGPQIALILRDPAFDVPVSLLATGDATLITALQQGLTLLQAAQAAAVARPEYDPQPILIRLMKSGVITLPQDIP